MSATDWIRLEGLRFDALVGILPDEQTRAQPLELELELGLPLERCASAGDLSLSVNYAEVAHATRFIAQQGRWRLLESLAMALCRHVLAPPVALEGRGAVQVVRVRIAKPTILGGLATPAVRIEREAGRIAIETRQDGPIRIETLEATPLSAAYRVLLSEGAVFTPPGGVAIRVIAGEVHHRGAVWGAGAELGRSAGVVRPVREALLLVVGDPLPIG